LEHRAVGGRTKRTWPEPAVARHGARRAAREPRRSTQKGLAPERAPPYLLCRYRRTIMQTRIQKWGNSLAVRIPQAFVKEAGVSYGTTVDVSVDDGKIVINPHIEPAYRLEDLLKGVTRRNIHAEFNTGEAVGREIW
jgi:antitoxin MazE